MQEVNDYCAARLSFMNDADALGASFFYFSPVNVIPKLWLGKVKLVRVGSGVGLVDGQGGIRVIPFGTQADYYQSVVAAISVYKSVLLLPDWIASHLGGGKQRKSLQHHEYMMATDAVRTHPGGRNAQVRGNINKARRLCTVEAFDPAKLAEFLALNRVWYRQVADAKFRTYDKVSIDTLLQRWGEVAGLCPDVVCLGVRECATDRLVSFNIGSALTEGVWTAYTQRFDREGPKAANSLGYATLGERFVQTVENDGTADSKQIREWKDRLGAPSLAAYRIDR